MRSWLRHPRLNPREHHLAVEAGQVVCPHRGIVDLESYWVCPAYRGLSTGRVESLLCASESTLLSSATSWLPTSATSEQ